MRRPPLRTMNWPRPADEAGRNAYTVLDGLSPSFPFRKGPLMVATQAPASRVPAADGRRRSVVGKGTNVNDTERLLSLVGGGLLALGGLSRGSLGGLALAAV